jgi:hypothetical protein
MHGLHGEPFAAGKVDITPQPDGGCNWWRKSEARSRKRGWAATLVGLRVFRFPSGNDLETFLGKSFDPEKLVARGVTVLVSISAPSQS